MRFADLLPRPAPAQPLGLNPLRRPSSRRASALALWLAWLILGAVVLAAASTDVRAAPGPAHTHPVQDRACTHCGVVTSVARIEQAGQPTGVGAMVGGAVGVLVGRELSRRDDRTPLVVLGAIGGGLIGHQIEKRVRRVTVYEVDVRMADGRVRQLTQPEPVRLGERVVVEDGRARPLDATGAAQTERPDRRPDAPHAPREWPQGSDRV